MNLYDVDHVRHLHRGPWSLDISRDGTVIVRSPGHTIREGFLPLFTAPTSQEAEDLVVLCCVSERTTNRYRMPHFRPDEQEDPLDAIDIAVSRIVEMATKAGIL